MLSETLTPEQACSPVCPVPGRSRGTRRGADPGLHSSLQCVWNPRVFADDARGWQCPFVLCLHPQGGVLCRCPEAEGIPVVFWVSHGVTVYPTARWEVTGRLDIVGAHSCPGREARGGRADRPGRLWPGPSWRWCSQPGSPTFLAPGIGFVEDNFSIKRC